MTASGRSLFALRTVMRQELRLLRADRSLWIIVALFAFLIAYGLFNGLTQTALHDKTLNAVLAEEDSRIAKQIVKLRGLYDGSIKRDAYQNSDDPSWMGTELGGRYAVMPSAPLAPLALGQSDLFPNYFLVTTRNKSFFMFDDTIQNPWHLLSGHLDLSFVIIYLFPLLIFALSYNLFSSEREQGTLRMVLAHPISIDTLVLGKVALRALVLMGLIVLLPMAALLLLRAGSQLDRAPADLALWALLVAAYGLFWFALAVAVSSLGKSSAANAMTLIASWLVLALVVPVLMNLAVSGVYPMPSRTDMTIKIRHETRVAKERHEDYNYEHMVPERTTQDKVDVPEFMTHGYLVQSDVIKVTEPLLREFEQQQARQQDLAARFRFLSPTMVVDNAMTAIAGTGLDRYRHFLNQVDQFHQRVRAYYVPKVFERTRLTEADFSTMPRYQWTDENRTTVVRRIWISIAGLLLPMLLLLTVGLMRLRRYPLA